MQETQAKKHSMWVDFETSTMVSVNPGKALEVSVTDTQQAELEKALEDLKSQDFEKDMEVANGAFLHVVKLVATFGTEATQKAIRGFVAHVQDKAKSS